MISSGQPTVGLDVQIIVYLISYSVGWSDIRFSKVSDPLLTSCSKVKMVAPSENSNPEDADPTIASAKTQDDVAPQTGMSSSDDVKSPTPSLSDVAQTRLNIQDIPREFGRYRIERELGRGGMGTVYLAHDEQLDRKVALKIPSFLSNDVGAIERFRREARAMATVQHANLCPVYDVGQFQQWHFLTMAFIDGQPLAAKLKAGSLSLFQCVSMLRTIALALEKAHQAGIVHRDLKPSNIMLTSQLDPIVMDFGLARKQSSGEAELTHANSVLGSPAYMAPEQVEARHDEVGPATDIYAMGIILYQMATGRRPYRGSAASIFGQVVSREPDPPSSLRAGVPPAIDAICLKAIAKPPSDRHVSAAEFAEELETYLNEAEDHAPTLNYERDKETPPSSGQIDTALDSGDLSTSRKSRGAERRQLTVMISNCDAIDSELSLASLDPEDQRDVLRAFHGVCDESITQRGGILIQSSGQELLACFGYPTAFEDAPHRAIRSGLQLLERMKLLNQSLQSNGKTPLSAWVAIHTGMVVAGDSNVSDSQVDTLSIIGEARTVASRLEALTEPEQLIISDATYRLVEGFFACESQGTQKIRGVTKPVELFRVVNEVAGRSRVELIDPATLTPLVGREMELGIIEDRWDHAIEGRGQVVLLTGDAGLGKSRLVREIKERIFARSRDEAPRVIEWRCSANHEGSSFYPVIEFFERLLEFSQKDSPEDRLDKLVRHLQELNLAKPEQLALFAKLLSIPPDGRCASVELSPALLKERTQELLLDWLRQFSSSQPVMFIVEDLHWIDPTTLEFLSINADQGHHDNILTLLSFRPEFRSRWQSASHVTQVALTRFTRKQIGEMISRITDVQAIPDEIVAKLAQRTDGVPLFVEEFSRIVDESGILKLDHDDRDLAPALDAIPVTLQDLLSARLDRLASNLDVVQLGAAIGREFSFELLSDASELNEVELQAELAKLVDAELLFQKGRPPKATYVFKHALIQDAAYLPMLKPTRQKFHRRIAEAIESHSNQTAIAQPELLAHHFSEAGETEKAVPYWLQAGQNAQLRSANTEAISHLTRGLNLLKSLEPTPSREQLELGFQLTLAPVLMAARGWSATRSGNCDRTRPTAG